MMLRHLESRSMRKFHPKKKQKNKKGSSSMNSVCFCLVPFVSEVAISKVVSSSLPSPPILQFLRFVCVLTSLPKQSTQAINKRKLNMQAREIINSKKCYLSDLLPTINLILFRCIQSSTSPTHFMKIKCDKSINQQNYLLKINYLE